MKDKKIFPIIIGVIVIIIIFYAIAKNYSMERKIEEVCIEDSCFKVELAITQEERSAGLMHREQLDLDKGMLFIFEKEDEHAFWMKNTLIPLDIIWIDSGNTIVDIKKEALPCVTETCETYYPQEKARYVLEINAGESDRNNITLGKIVRFK